MGHESDVGVVGAGASVGAPGHADEKGFAIEPELTARLAQARARIYELPISYDGRSYADGKKIGWKDGVAAIWYIFRCNLVGPKAKPWHGGTPHWLAQSESDTAKDSAVRQGPKVVKAEESTHEENDEASGERPAAKPEAARIGHGG